MEPRMEDVFCEHVLRRILSFAEYDCISKHAPHVCKRWRDAACCKEAWRRKVHPALLSLLSSGTPGRPPLPVQLAHPGRLYRAVYSRNLIQNGTFLEKLNAFRVGSSQGGMGPGGWGHVWVPTTDVRGLTWTYPLLDPDCPPFPIGGPPFRQGCIATAGRWSELIQVVDLKQQLQQQGVPEVLAGHLLASRMTLTFSLLVASSQRASQPAAVQVVVVGLGPQVAINDWPLVALPQLLVPPPDTNRPDTFQGLGGRLRKEGLPGMGVQVVGPLDVAPGCWQRLEFRLDTSQLPANMEQVVIALRGRGRHAKAGHHGARLASARLEYLPEDRAPIGALLTVVYACVDSPSTSSGGSSGCSLAKAASV